MIIANINLPGDGENNMCKADVFRDISRCCEDDAGKKK